MAQTVDLRMFYEGGCLCGAVRYRSTAGPLTARLCWCRLCQYLAAGNSTVNVCFARDTVDIIGRLHDFRSVADSGSVMHRRFCPSCGTPMFSEAETRPHLIFIRAGTLDEPDLIRPSATIWTSEAPSWAFVHEDFPSFPAQPPPAA